MQKVFLEHNGLRLVSDARDIVLPGKLTADVREWCNKNEVMASINHFPNDPDQQWTTRLFNVNVWRIKDKDQRALFILRWGSGL
jgi:hypothetical protein